MKPFAPAKPFLPIGVALALVAVLLLSPQLGHAQQMTTREVKLQAQRCLQEGAYEDAIGLIQQLLEWFGQSTNRAIIAEMEKYYFSLGLCFYLTGQFGEADKAFAEYLKRYRNAAQAHEAAVYMADGLRFTGKTDDALKAYRHVLSKYRLNDDWATDVLCSMARCVLSKGDWQAAVPMLENIYRTAPDDLRANWAATLLTIAYLKEMQVDKVFGLVPYLLKGDSLASRSVAFNVSALEAGDTLFADERYREALWIYRLIYRRELIQKRSEHYLEDLQGLMQELRESQRGAYREMLRTQETIAELEEEITALEPLENYDFELDFRIARAYLETRRYYAARAFLLELHEEAQDASRAEECLYLAFECSAQLKPWERAFDIGDRYLEKYPKGDYYDHVSVTMGQMYAMLERWPEVIDLLTKALEISPQHESGAECMFLIGYACFMEERLADSISWLRKLNHTYPGNDRAEEATYWLGMALMFDRQYGPGLDTFIGFIGDFPDSAYVEDATFRRAVCEYGLSRYREAESHLLAFVETYAQSKLLGEANMMLADISGYFGELQTAVQRFQKALDHGEDLNIELYNYCSFRCGEMLDALNDYATMIQHFKLYITKNRDDSNIPMAVYWVGKALWQLDRHQEAMEFMLKSVKTFGSDRKALGVDLILDEWVARSKGLSDIVREEAWRFLHALIREAIQDNNASLALRLQRTFLHRPGLSDQARETILAHVLKHDNIPEAPAAVLELMMDEAQKTDNMALGRQAAEKIVEDYPETDYEIAARMMLARLAMDENDYQSAESHLKVVTEVYAANIEAAQALLMLGELYIKQRRFEHADMCFQRVLSVKEWRGPLWPAALFGRGECAREQRDFAQASAYYERIYVLYSNHTQWAAKAYLERANCLLRLQEADKARETLEEMLSIPELTEAETAEEAARLLARLQRRSQ